MKVFTIILYTLETSFTGTGKIRKVTLAYNLSKSDRKAVIKCQFTVDLGCSFGSNNVEQKTNDSFKNEPYGKTRQCTWIAPNAASVHECR